MKTLLRSLPLLLLPLSFGLADDAAKRHDDHMATIPTEAPATPPDVTGGMPVAYTKAGGKPVEGTLYKAAKQRPGVPGVVVVHEWWGLNDEVRAKAGFNALAVDLYAGQAASEPEAAKKLAGAVRGDLPGVVANLADAAAYLKREVGCQRVASMGWCLGGGFALELALARPDEVAAVVMYYGQVKEKAEELATLKAPVMGHFGGLDQGIPLAGVRTFRKLVKAKGCEARILIYPEAGHAFSNPTRMATYRPVDAAEAWKKSLAFLQRHLIRPAREAAAAAAKAKAGQGAPAPASAPAAASPQR